MLGEKKEDYAWDSYRDRIEAVNIKSGVTKLGAYAFADCPKLDKVYFNGNSLTDIKEGCFSGCPNLGKTNPDFEVPSSVSYIGTGAFAGAGFQTFSWPALAKSRIMPRTFENCPYLVSVLFPTGFDFITSNAAIEDEAFKGCSSLISFTVPSGTKSIAVEAFSGCSSIKSVSMPEGLTAVQQSAFAGCCKLTTVNFPTSIQSIDQEAFSGCSKLSKVDLSACTQTVSLMNKAFYGCDALTDLRLPARTSDYFACIDKCKSLKTITIPDGVKGVYHMNDCPALEKVVIPASVNKIVSPVFENSNNVVLYVTAPSYAYEWALNNGIPYAFTNGGSCGDNLKWYYDAAGKELVITGFGNMDNYPDYSAPWKDVAKDAQTVTIEKRVTSVGSNAFYGMNNLQAAYVSDTVKSIGDGAFASCPNLTTLSIPDSVRVIGKDIIKGSSKVEIKTTDGSAAADYAASVGAKTTAKSSTALKQDNPQNDTETTEQTFEKDGYTYKVVSKDSVILTGTKKSSLKKITVPDTVTGKSGKYKVTSIAATAFKGQKKATSAVIGKNVTSIGKNAFNGCGKLKKVTIKTVNLKSIGKGAFKSIQKTATFKLPAKITKNKTKLKKYTKMIKTGNAPKNRKIK
ncbi:MAG: leucine-rich repeat domain-containing protein [Lachnospiraceae bacterium]|nr:leucine-rich repeat domain-containing protein [Lachnospiraceae bacterium]